MKLYHVLWTLLFCQLACSSKSSEHLPVELKVETMLSKFTTELKPVKTSINDTFYINQSPNYQVEQLITYEKGIMVHSVTTYKQKKGVVLLPNKHIQHNALDVKREEFSIELPKTSFYEGFAWVKSRLDTTDLMGDFIHNIFPDSIPTTAWEQLIHQGSDEATVVVKTDKGQKVNTIFFDVNPERSTNTLRLSQVGETFVIHRSML